MKENYINMAKYAIEGLTKKLNIAALRKKAKLRKKQTKC